MHSHSHRLRHRMFGSAVALLALSAVPLAAQTGAGQPGAVGSTDAPAQASDDATTAQLVKWFRRTRLDRQYQYEALLNQVPLPESLRVNHLRFTSEPHPAGSAADERLINDLDRTFQELGVEVERHDFWPLLSTPIDASVRVLHGDDDIELSLIEKPVPGDSFSQHPDRPIGYNAYSASGTVTAEVVYANRGTKADFAKLREMGVDCTGRIVIARYGGNYRGYKAKFAEEAGAIGLIIYTDPRDSGYTRGEEYPEGGFCNGTSIQRGSIMTLPYAGDALTPGVEATEDAERLAPDDVALPRIPVQPMGWDSASEILSRMSGDPLPEELKKAWQGTLPFAYHLTGGPELTVRLHVEQERAIKKTTNVIGRIEGARFPGEMVIVGCHFDAWTFGAGDPHAGTIVMYEMARSFAHAANQGFRPDRTILFANWAAEEYGIIGSTEWVEANRLAVGSRAVAYINLDMAAMGDNFRGSSSPELAQAIIDATRDVPQSHGTAGQTVYDAWMERTNGSPTLGTLGGGSDHVGFYCHLGVPSCGIGGSGADGVSYHSNYDTVAWYNKAVDEDYESAMMVTRVANTLVARLANADLIPIETTALLDRAAIELRAVHDQAEEIGLPSDVVAMANRMDALSTRLAAVLRVVRAADAVRPLDGQRMSLLNMRQRMWTRLWLDPAGLPERPWFKNVFAATDPDSGYASWTFPAFRLAVQNRDAAMYAKATQSLKVILERFDAHLYKLEHVIENNWLR